MGFLSASSSALIFCAGLGIMVCWTIASGDSYLKDDTCGGCIYLFHQSLNNAPIKLKSHYRLSKDAFPYLLTFGLVCGVLWMATAFLVVKAKYYLIFGITGTTIFICVFVPLLERMRRNKLCKLYAEIMEEDDMEKVWKDECKSEGHWQLKHMYDSYEIFWGSSIAFFLMSVYQIACAIALVYEDRTGVKDRGKYQEKILEDNQEVRPNQLESESESKLKNSNKVTPEEVKESRRERCIERRNQDVSIHELIKDESVLATPYDIATSAIIGRTASIVVRRGQIAPPEESPVPSFEAADLSATKN